jgi:hypothetical protein
MGPENLVLVAVGDRHAWVDVGIAPLVRWCWQEDLACFDGCEGGGRGDPWADLRFDDAEELLAFSIESCP